MLCTPIAFTTEDLDMELRKNCSAEEHNSSAADEADSPSTADAEAPADFTAEGLPDFSIHRLQQPELREPRPGVRHNLSTRSQPPLLQLSACTGSVQDHSLASVLRARPVAGLHYQCPQVTPEATPSACHQPHILSLASTATFTSAAGLCSPTSVHRQSGPLLSL